VGEEREGGERGGGERGRGQRERGEREGEGGGEEKERDKRREVLFIGTQFSHLYT
jgi:hypothetical protein